MKILLQSNRTVEEIKEEFGAIYPFLRIAFFAGKEDAAGGKEVPPLTQLIEVSGILKEGIEIKSTDTIKEVELKFEKQYDLPVRIFRKQKGMWVSANVTDDLTLHEQNTWGREASKPLKFRSDDHIDWNRFSLGK